MESPSKSTSPPSPPSPLISTSATNNITVTPDARTSFSSATHPNHSFSAPTSPSSIHSFTSYSSHPANLTTHNHSPSHPSPLTSFSTSFHSFPNGAPSYTSSFTPNASLALDPTTDLLLTTTPLTSTKSDATTYPIHPTLDHSHIHNSNIDKADVDMHMDISHFLPTDLQNNTTLLDNSNFENQFNATFITPPPPPPPLPPPLPPPQQQQQQQQQPQYPQHNGQVSPQLPNLLLQPKVLGLFPSSPSPSSPLPSSSPLPLPSSTTNDNFPSPNASLLSSSKLSELTKLDENHTEISNPSLPSNSDSPNQNGSHPQTPPQPQTQSVSPSQPQLPSGLSPQHSQKQSQPQLHLQSYSEQQLEQLKHQVYAYKYLNKNLPLPSTLLQRLLDYTPQTNVPATPTSVTTTAASQATHVKPAPLANLPAPPAPSTPTIPSQLNTPSQHATEPVKSKKCTIVDPWKVAFAIPSPAHSRTLYPSITPLGVDTLLLIEARDRRIQSRIQHRLSELQSMEINPLDTSTQQTKLNALIEMKSLRLAQKQKKLREEILLGLHHSSILYTCPDKNAFKRIKKHTVREPKLTERLERQQTIEREKKERLKHQQFLNVLLTHSYKLKTWQARLQERWSKLGRNVLVLHTRLEKDEKERKQKIAQERLRALKAGDEEAYMKLIDQAKDTRITHLLNQTNAFLESLALAVASQKESIQSISEMEIPEESPQIEDELIVKPDELTVVPEEDDGKLDYYHAAHRIREPIHVQPTILVGGKLKEYQLRGLEWMVSLYNNRLNGILADEMGLGKTIQTISLVTFLIEHKRQLGPYLIIVPLSTITNWSVEFEKWAPSVKTIVFKGTPMQRKHLAAQIRAGQFHVLLTTFEYIIRDRPVLCKIKWLYTIIDEGHRMKNSHSRLSVTLCQFYASRYRLILTGTPLQNNLPELWSLLNFILPKIFNSLTSFDDWFSAPFADVTGEDKITLSEEETLLVIKRLHKVLRPFLLRRLKKDVESELPDKVERIIKTKLSALQKKLYDQVCNFGAIFAGGTNDRKGGIRGLNNTVMQLRKICNHPFVFEEVESVISPHLNIDDNIFRTSGKFELLDRILTKLLGTGHRVLIFFQMTQIMSIMSDYLTYRNYMHLKLDGSTKADDRQEYLKLFNAPGSPYPVFLLSTRAGGLGLNLQSADTVIIFDSDWNPHQDLQAQDRAHRIGQTKEVRIFRLITEHSIEERILARAQFKLDMDGKVIQAGKFDNKSTAEERESFLRSLIENDNTTDPNDEEELTNEELNEILARSEEEKLYFAQVDQAMQEAEWQLGLEMGLSGPRERLFSEAELPDVFQRDLNQVLKEREELERAEGPRQKKEVVYDDGLTEEQFCLAIEDETYKDFIQNQQTRPSRGMKRKAAAIAASASNPSTGLAQSSLSSSTSSSMSSSSGTPQVGSPQYYEDDSERKRKRGRPRKSNQTEAVPPRPEGPKASATEYKHMEQVVGKVMHVTDPEQNDRSRSVLFFDLPSKRDYPTYYFEIKEPICLKQIQNKIKHQIYASLEEFKHDMLLMFANACQFNQEGSMVYNDALVLKQVMLTELEDFGKQVLHNPITLDPFTSTSSSPSYREENE